MKRNILLLIALIVTVASAHATIHKAITSGSYSTSSTWESGIVPLATLSANDTMIITSGVTVTSDSFITVSSPTAGLIVESNAEYIANPSFSSSFDIIVDSGFLAGSGKISLARLNITNTQQLNGSLIVEASDVHLNNVEINSDLNINIKKYIYFDSTASTINRGTITLSDKCAIQVRKQAPQISSNVSLVFEGTYSVFMYGSFNTTKPFISDTSKLETLLLDIDSNTTFHFESDISVSYLFQISACTVAIHNHKLTMEDSSKLGNDSFAYFAVTPQSKIILRTLGNNRVPIKFIPGQDTLNTLEVKAKPFSSMVLLGTNLYVKDSINILSGRIYLNDNDLQLISGCIFTHNNTNSHISTEGKGRLIRYIPANDSINFPLSTYYKLDTISPLAIQKRMPISITNNGSNGVYVGAKVMQDVYKDPVAATGVKLSDKTPLVRCTWFLSSDNMNIKLDVHAIWQRTPPPAIGNIEVNKFDRDKCYISNYTNSSWDLAPKGAATDLGNDYYTITRKDVTSLGAFAVFHDTFVSVDNTVVKPYNTITLHPNPATDILTITNKEHSSVTAIMQDVTGKVVKTITLQRGENIIDVNDLAGGVYMVTFKNTNMQTTKKFVKQ